MDLLPGANLELRIYVLLGIVGVMFFGAILALGVGRIISLKASSNFMSLGEDSSFSNKPEKESKQRKQKSAKPRRNRQDKDEGENSFETVEEILAEPKSKIKESKSREKEPKQSRFSKKKHDAIEMLSSPSGYVEEYAPVDSRNMDSDHVPSVTPQASAKYDSGTSSNDIKNEDNWDDDFLTDSSQTVSEEDKKKNGSSPFAKNEDWEF
jgi:hypothetical protein